MYQPGRLVRPKKLTLLSTMLLSLLLLAASSVTADQIQIDYTFEAPAVKQVMLDGQSYDRVIMPDAPNGGNTGEPSLPARGARILIPNGHEVESIEVSHGDGIWIGSGYNVEPVTLPFKLSEGPGAANTPRPDRAIYTSSTPWPQDRAVEVNTGNLRGYTILTLKLNPVEYTPNGGELYYYPELTVTVSTVESGIISPLLRGTYEDEQTVLAKVDNQKELDSYAVSARRLDPVFDMMILTTSTLSTAFQPLKDYHDSTGITTQIHTTADVGSTDPTAVRDYIRDRYINDGIQYVLIGADDDIIPALDLYVESWEGSGAEIETEMPGDIYFACLDGTYDYDTDGVYGEPGDGDGGSEVDLIAEVYVGRATVGNSTEAARFVSKTLSYTASADPYLQEILMCGEFLDFGGVSDYAGNMMDQIVDGSSADGYTTVGIPSDVMNVNYLYDRDWAGNDWPQSEIITRINNGLHYINHLGHGNSSYAMKLYSSDVSSLTNDDLCFVYSQACYSGQFDGMDGFAENLHIKTDHGAFSVIMNARYGWGSSNSTDGPSQRFDREFWDAVYNSGESKPEIGRANHDSKEDNLYRLNESCMRWCYYEITLFGDPAIAIKGVGGLTFSYPGGIPGTVTPGQTTTFDVQVGTFGDGTPVSASGQLHYSISGGLEQTVSMVEVSPDLYEATLPAISCGDYIDFYISVEEATVGRQYDPDPSSPNRAVAATTTVTAFEDDFETDKGWSVSGGQWNRGTPTGGGGEYGNPDPSSAYEGTNVFGYNLSGDYANSIPEYHLTSPAIDCSGLTNVHLNFFRWLGVEQPAYDHAYIRISTNGSSWTTVWENDVTVADASWTEIDLDISSIADDQSTVYVRFTMGTTDSGWRYCGWNIDNFQVTGSECESNPTLTITTVSLPDCVAGDPYSQTLTATGGVGTLVWTDKNSDLPGSGLSLSSGGVLSGTPSASGTVSFTAMVTDDDSATDEKLLTVNVLEALSITTTTLPGGYSGESYSQSLSAVGGVGAYTWTDKYGDLAGTGLALSLTGVVSGVPSSAGSISFTAVVNDEDSHSDEAVLTVDVLEHLNIETTMLPDWTEGHPFSELLSATGGEGPLTWSDKNGDLAGSGLSLSTDGTLSGTPTGSGTVSFTAMVTDEGSQSDEQLLSLEINPAMTIGTSSVQDWTVNVAYDVTLDVSGGTGSSAEMTWSDRDGSLVGSGLTISSAGRLWGTPIAAGPISFTAQVTDLVGATADQLVEFTINPAVSVTTTEIPDGTEDEAYSYQIETAGGTGTRGCEDANGDLAGTGLSLSVDGLLSGTPTDTGTVNFMFRVYDQVGSDITRAFEIRIQPAWMCGDLNGDFKVTLSDITAMIDHVYISKLPLDNPLAGNVNGSVDGKVTLSDITSMIDHVYISKLPLNCL